MSTTHYSLDTCYYNLDKKQNRNSYTVFQKLFKIVLRYLLNKTIEKYLDKYFFIIQVELKFKMYRLKFKNSK